MTRAGAERRSDTNQVSGRNDLLALDRAGARERRNARAEAKADAIVAADGIPPAETKLAQDWKQILFEAAEKLVIDDLEDYRRRLHTIPSREVLVAAALLEELGPKPPVLAAQGVHDVWNDKKRAVQRVGAYFGKFTFGQISKRAIDGYWKVCSALAIGSIKPGSDDPKFLSYTQIQQDLDLLRRAMRNYAADNRLDFVPTVAIPKEKVTRDVFLSRSQVARMLWACRGRYWDREVDGWLKVPIELPAPDGVGTVTKWVNFIDENAKKHRKGLARALLVEVYTGTRHECCIRLKYAMSKTCGWIDVETGQIHRVGTAHKKTRKTLTPTSPIIDRLAQHVRRWRAADGNDGSKFIIRKYDRSRYGSLTKPFNDIVEAAGLDPDVVVHTYRHTLATWACIMGVDQSSAADYLGMAPATLDKIYRHFSAANAMNVVEAFRDPNKRARLKAIESQNTADQPPINPKADYAPVQQRPRRVVVPKRIVRAFERARAARLTG